MYLYSTHSCFTPENTVCSSPFLPVRISLCALARRCTSLLASSIIEPVCSAPHAVCISLSFHVCCEYLCVLGRLAPRMHCICIPCRTCRAFPLFSFYFVHAR